MWTCSAKDVCFACSKRGPAATALAPLGSMYADRYRPEAASHRKRKRTFNVKLCRGVALIHESPISTQ